MNDVSSDNLSDAEPLDSDCLPSVERAHHWAPYSNRDALIEEICARLATGESLTAICSESRMPSYTIVHSWRSSSTEIAERFAVAREHGEDAIAERLPRIAAGEEGISTRDVMRDKLLIDTQFKLLAKFNPKRWGDSTQLRHADADGGKLDTAPLVSELLGLMSGQNAQSGAAAAPAKSQVSARLVREAPAALERQAPDAHDHARPVYRPRAARSDDVGDLV